MQIVATRQWSVWCCSNGLAGPEASEPDSNRPPKPLIFNQLRNRGTPENRVAAAADDCGSILEAQRSVPEVLPNFLLRKLYTNAKRAAA